MMFSVIYDFDVPMNLSVRRYAPPQLHLWQQTERADGEPSDWCSELFDGKCKHRKYCAVLTRKQFDRFIDQVGLFPEDVETMGSLGAPGFGFGLAPAISFRNDDPEVIQSAYVTPFPSFKPTTGASDSEKNWRRIRAAVLRVYGH